VNALISISRVLFYVFSLNMRSREVVASTYGRSTMM